VAELDADASFDSVELAEPLFVVDAL